jgi:hypothetical protein
MEKMDEVRETAGREFHYSQIGAPLKKGSSPF